MLEFSPNENSNFPFYHLTPGPGIVLICLRKGNFSCTTVKSYYNTTCHSIAFRTKPIFIMGINRKALLHSTDSFIIWLMNIICCPKTKITQELPSKLDSETHGHSQTKVKIGSAYFWWTQVSSFYAYPPSIHSFLTSDIQDSHRLLALSPFLLRNPYFLERDLYP